jgi:hypothetical protein
MRITKMKVRIGRSDSQRPEVKAGRRPVRSLRNQKSAHSCILRTEGLAAAARNEIAQQHDSELGAADWIWPGSVLSPRALLPLIGWKMDDGTQLIFLQLGPIYQALFPWAEMLLSPATDRRFSLCAQAIASLCVRIGLSRFLWIT